jgi:hypothetical protein
MSEKTVMMSLTIVVTNQEYRAACEMAEEIPTFNGVGIHVLKEAITEETVTEFVRKLINTARVAGLTGMIDEHSGKFIAGWLSSHQ